MSVSPYSSSFVDKYRIKRAQSGSQKSAKTSKKSSRRRFYSSNTSEDSPRVRKRKNSKKNHDHEDKKKAHPKKPRRDPSISSTNSDSRSCSTSSRGGSISSHDVHKKNSGRYVKEEMDERNLRKVKGGSKKSRYRSGSRSSCSRCSESSEYFSDEKVSTDSSWKSLRRLRSVITVVEKDEDGRELSRGEDKEEIIHFQDDYPSYRSNDSNDGESKREEDHNVQVVSEQSIMLEEDKGDETAVLNVKITKPEDVNKVSNQDCVGIRGGNYAISDKHIDEFRTMHPVNEKTNEVPGVAGGLKGDDLESLLRHRALENLKRFKGGQKDKNHSNMKQSSGAKAESVQTKHPKEDNSRVAVKSIETAGAEVVSSTKMLTVKETHVPAFKRDAMNSYQNDRNFRDARTCNYESASAKETSPTDQIAGSSNPNIEVNLHAQAVQPESTTRELMSHSLKTSSSMNQEAISSQEPPQAKPFVTETSLDKTLKVGERTMIGRSGNDNAVPYKDRACGSTAPGSSGTPKSSLVEKKSDNPQDEVKDASQFEQKTMSVMRGGEMVQVSAMFWHIVSLH